MDRRRPTDAEIEERLTAYASARLSPDPEWTARTRAALVDLAERRGRASSTVVDLDAARARRGLALPSLARFRRTAVAGLLAASLAVASVSLVLAAGPASPLYPARLWLESVTTPASSGDLSSLDRRLSEAQDAATHGQGAAVSAALEAYRQSVLDALKAAGNDEEKLARLNAALGVHDVVLQTLASDAPSSAKDAVQAAIEANHDAAAKAGGDKPRPTPKP
jgi:hypothetical protein